MISRIRKQCRMLHYNAFQLNHSEHFSYFRILCQIEDTTNCILLRNYNDMFLSYTFILFLKFYMVIKNNISETVRLDNYVIIL